MNHEDVLRHARAVRGFTTMATQDLSNEQLIHIPAGSRNNILWNVGLAITDQCNMLYTPSGIAVPLPDGYHAWFDPGTSPAGWSDNLPDPAGVLETAKTLVATVERDFAGGRFVDFDPTAFDGGLRVNSVVEAINYCTIHEAIHLGVILTLRKLVSPAP
jgi:hypothetical protein